MPRTRRLKHVPVAMLGAATMLGIGCSSSGGSSNVADGQAATTETDIATALDGVQIDVRRDPG